MSEELEIKAQQSIEQLSNLEESHRGAVESLDRQRQILIDEVMTEEIRKALKDIDEEFAPHYLAINTTFENDMAQVKDEITQLVTSLGHTVKGSRMLAIYSSPRVTWDLAALEGYAVAHPEINQFKKVGTASVSFRKVAQKGEKE